MRSSHAVQGLSIDAVAIEDQFGNNYTAQDGITDVQDISALKMRLEEQTNNKIRTRDAGSDPLVWGRKHPGER